MVITRSSYRSEARPYPGGLCKQGQRGPFGEAYSGGMSVAKVTEINATSTKSFEDALQQGIARAHKTLRNIKGAWIKEQQVGITNGAITEYRVNMMVTFVLDD